MFKTLAFMMQNNAFLRALRGFSWAAGPPSSAISMAVSIIADMAGMFNEKQTLLEIFRE